MTDGHLYRLVTRGTNIEFIVSVRSNYNSIMIANMYMHNSKQDYTTLIHIIHSLPALPIDLDLIWKQIVSTRREKGEVISLPPRRYPKCKQTEAQLSSQQSKIAIWLPLLRLIPRWRGFLHHIIVITDIRLKTRSFELHFCRTKFRYIFNHFYAVRPESYRFGWMAIMPFKVIQGHRFWYQSKAHVTTSY